jgi:DNA repair exonuclease SbcCD ATPase subunit
MSDEELKEIKTRAEEIEKLLGDYSSSLQSMVSDIPKLVGEIEQLREELYRAETCEHGNFYEERTCVECFGDGTEEKRDCHQCGTETWHRGGKCVRHDKSTPKPYEPLKAEVEQLRSQIQETQEQSSARLTAAQERLKTVETSRTAMREALEYVKGRLGSGNIGESLGKIDRALAGDPDGAPAPKEPAPQAAGGSPNPARPLARERLRRSGS